jgi:hypothetical protein
MRLERPRVASADLGAWRWTIVSSSIGAEEIVRSPGIGLAESTPLRWWGSGPAAYPAATAVGRRDGRDA